MGIRQAARLAAALVLADLVRCAQAFNNPPSVDVWCGKAYRETNSSFNPGGWLEPPSQNNGSTPLRLSLNIYPRYDFYLDTERGASFVVDARVSDRGSGGGTYVNSTHGNGNETEPFTELVLSVWNGNTTVVSNFSVPVNSSSIEVPFDLDLIKRAGEGSTITLRTLGGSPDGRQTYEGSVHVVLLPERTDGGSMARLDRLNNGIHVSSRLTHNTWKPLLPMGFYTRWDWISWLVDPTNNPIPPNLTSNFTPSLQAYKARGYNLIHPVPPGGYSSFDSPTLEKFLTLCDELELYVMYDMRHTYLNLSSIATQLPRLQSHPSLLLYYTGDEPDGWTDPLNGTRLAYNQIKSIDPYHPVSLVLNCYNFYFEEYTSGADIILEDTYPLILSSEFSPVYNTACNSTYGDCGCDVCHAGDAAYPEFVDKPFEDVIVRTDRMYAYQDWLGQGVSKPVWGVPQWFFDADSFWSRWATGQESIVMAVLRINHGSMGIVGWLFPTAPEVETATTGLAKVLAREDVTQLLITGERRRLEVSGEGGNDLDVAVWIGRDEILVIVVWPKDTAGEGGEIHVPTRGKSITGLETVFGTPWDISGSEAGVLEMKGVQAMEVSILKVTLEE